MSLKEEIRFLRAKILCLKSQSSKKGGTKKIGTSSIYAWSSKSVQTKSLTSTSRGFTLGLL